MAYVFNEEDKVKWSELSPSLQARFTELENMRHSLTVNSQDRIRTTRLTISRIAPTKPANNADLWIDEKYRIARAFTEYNWEFTRAAWATSGFVPSNPQTSTDIPPDPSGGSTTPVNKSFNFITQVDNPTTGQVSRTYGSEVSSLRGNNYSRVEINPISIYGYNVVMKVTAISSPGGSHVGNLIYTVNGTPYYKQLIAGNTLSISLTTGTNPVFLAFLAEIETYCYNLRNNSPIIYPVDSESANDDLGTEIPGYQYVFHVSQYLRNNGLSINQLSESMMKNMARGSIGTGNPPFVKTGSSNLTIKIDFTYTTYA